MKVCEVQILKNGQWRDGERQKLVAGAEPNFFYPKQKTRTNNLLLFTFLRYIHKFGLTPNSIPSFHLHMVKKLSLQ